MRLTLGWLAQSSKRPEMVLTKREQLARMQEELGTTLGERVLSLNQFETVSRTRAQLAKTREVLEMTPGERVQNSSQLGMVSTRQGQLGRTQGELAKTPEAQQEMRMGHETPEETRRSWSWVPHIWCRWSLCW